jgi:hypothetical protein
MPKRLRDPVPHWLENKDDLNEWVLECFSPATSLMSKGDWYSTSRSTNLAESPHRFGQRRGTHLTLVGAIQEGKRIDQRFIEVRDAVMKMGVMSKHGNMRLTGRTRRNLRRMKMAAEKKGREEQE